jgi:hypothetical protein
MNIYGVTYVQFGSYTTTNSGSMNLGACSLGTEKECFMTINAASQEIAEAAARKLTGHTFRSVKLLGPAE